jgi:hypothetical protein
MSVQDALAQQIEVRAAVHLDPVDVASMLPELTGSVRPALTAS